MLPDAWDQAERIANALDGNPGKTKKTSTGWIASCPAIGHAPDKHPSLSVGVKSGGVKDTVVFHCQKGCSYQSVAAVLTQMGLWGSDYVQPHNHHHASSNGPSAALAVSKPTPAPPTTASAPGGAWKTTASYPYDDDAGQIIAIKVRRERVVDGVKEKVTPWRLPGRPSYGLDGLAVPMYRLSQLSDESCKSALVVEGEKCVHAIPPGTVAEGTVITCPPHGGGTGKWRPQYTQHLARAKAVYLCPDSDEAGQVFMKEGAKSLREAGHKVYWVDLGYPLVEKKGKDVADLLDELPGEAGVVALQEAIAEAKPWVPERRENVQSVMTMASLLTQDMPDPFWLIPQILPAGATVLGGDPQVGKSVMGMNLMLSLALGAPALGYFPVDTHSSLYLALDGNSPLMLRARWRSLSGNKPVDGIYNQCHWDRLDQGGTEDLRDFLEDHPDVKLVVVDTLQCIRPDLAKVGSWYSADYNAVIPLQQIGLDMEVAILILHHLNQNVGITDPLKRLQGTNGIPAASEGTMVLDRPRGEQFGRLQVTQRNSAYGDMTYNMRFKGGHWTLIPSNMPQNVVSFQGKESEAL